MDFIIGLPNNFQRHDSIMVVLDKLRLFILFLLNLPIKVVNIPNIFMKEIFSLHGVLKVIVSDRDAKFTGNFWKALLKGLGTQLNFSTAYHPQTDG